MSKIKYLIDSFSHIFNGYGLDDEQLPSNILAVVSELRPLIELRLIRYGVYNGKVVVFSMAQFHELIALPPTHRDTYYVLPVGGIEILVNPIRFFVKYPNLTYRLYVDSGKVVLENEEGIRIDREVARFFSPVDYDITGVTYQDLNSKYYQEL